MSDLDLFGIADFDIEEPCSKLQGIFDRKDF